MEYKELATLYHMNARATRDSELRDEEMRRRTADSSFSTGFTVPYGELFIATPRELTVLSELVLRTERHISQLMREVPPIANRAVLRGLVLDEVVSTNAIEQIQSTRQQVQAALESVSGNDKRRFRELGLLYLDIVSQNALIPSTPAEIRSIFDRVMAGESPEEQGPYGELFRSSGVSIIGEGGRVLHSGLEPESRITQAMQSMLELSRSDNMPSLYAALASHYIFEYVHPFYDGNGRTGRYLLSLFLSESLSVYTVLSLSRIIAENRSDYYRAFRSVEDPLNRGELTFFVYTLLELIRKAQVDLIVRMEKGKESYSKLESAILHASLQLGLKDNEREIVFMLMQYGVFGLIGDISTREVAEHLGLGDQMARIHLKSLEDKGVIEKIRKRNPVTFALTRSFKAEYGIR